MAGANILGAASISPQIIVSQQLPATEGAIYSVGLGKSVKVAHGTICNVTSNLAPTLTLGTPSSTGGTLAANTYYWKVTAQSSGGQSLGSNEVTVTTTGTTSSQPLSWAPVPTAISYNIYRGTTSGGEGTLVSTVTGTTYTDAGATGSAVAMPTVSTFGTAVSVSLSLVPAGATVGDGTHRILNSYSLAANDTLSLKDYIGGVMLGPGDMIAGYAALATGVDFVVSGTVHA